MVAAQVLGGVVRQEVVGQVGVKGVVFTQGRITRYILSIKKTCP
jgi:hypothetical protein